MVYQLDRSTADCKTDSRLTGDGGNREDNTSFGVVSMILMAILAPMAAMGVQMTISRSRDDTADKDGAEICGQPLALALASALAKIAGAAHRVPNYEVEGHPATAHMFIINPLSGARMDNLFSTHPATENRIAALQELAQRMGGGGFGAGVARGGTMPRGPWAGGARKRGPWG